MTTPSGVEIGPLEEDEREALFELFAAVVAADEGYPQSPPLSREAFEQAWGHGVSAVVAARAGDVLAGAYYLKPNFTGRAAHIANAGYVVAAPFRGRGIGRALVEDSIQRAPALGFDAIQFNLVRSSNPARRLYERLGWRVTGTVPDAIDGEDAVVYWRRV